MNSKKLSISCAIAVILATMPARAQNQPDYQVIQQQIAQSQVVLAASKRQLEQFLLADIPAVQTGTAENIELIKELTAKVATMNVEVQASNSQLARVRDQLSRTQAIYQAKQQELNAAQQRAQALQNTIRDNNERVSKQNLDAEQSTAQISAMAAETTAAATEIARLNDYINRAEAEISRRTALAAQVTQTQEQHLDRLAVLQKESDASQKVLTTLQRRVAAIDQRINAEKANWQQVDKEIADREAQQTQLSSSIKATQNESNALNAAILSKEQEIADAKIASANKQQLLSKLAALQKELSARLKTLTGLQQQMLQKDQRLELEKNKWQEIDKTVAGGDAQLLQRIETTNSEITKTKAELLSKDQEMTDAMATTASKRQLLAKLSGSQNNLSANQDILAELRGQVVDKNQRIALEKAKWEKIDKTIASRNEQKTQLSARLEAADNETSAIQATLLDKDQEIAATKLETENKKQLLEQEVKQISALKKNLRDAEQRVRAAKKDLSNGDNAGSKEMLIKEKLMRDIADSKKQVVILKRSEIDMQAEIQQLQKLMEGKSEGLAPLRAEIEALRSEKTKTLQEQTQQRIKIKEVNQALVKAENSYQMVANQERELRAEKQKLLN
jgi:chromosome segregation ATPase